MKKIITIFGSTGNLMYKKLIPAFDNLIKHNYLDSDTQIYVVARKNWNLEEYIEDAKKQVTVPIDWDKLTTYLKYIEMDITNLDDYYKLKDLIDNFKEVDRMFYLAVPPSLFPTIAKGISTSGLIKKDDENSRIVFEKPFGEDLKTAKKINQELWSYFSENQIYRIDHYLGKEMIQNILVVRFANFIFEKNWDNSSIESIVILAKETEGIMNRGNYYDKVGALKDMVQSHLMQMASLVTMEKPETYNSNDIKNEKVKAIKSLKIDPNNIILGQYKGYKNTKNVDPDSNTETFVYLKACLNNKRFKNVPIHFLTGKMLDEKRSEIIVNFKHSNSSYSSAQQNKLVIKVAPKEGVNFILNVKEAGLTESIIPVKLDYCHSCSFLGNTPEAYEKLLLDLFNKQNSLFTRWDEIESSWKIIDELKGHELNVITYETYEDLKKIIIKQSEDIKYDL